LNGIDSQTPSDNNGSRAYIYLAVLLVSATVYLGCIISPPSLMDDVDATQATIARNMLTSGDWVTARLDHVAFLEKPPFGYWAMAVSYKIFGVHDWAARIPIALTTVALCALTAAFGAWAFGKRAGLYAGLCMSTCLGLFLFTRVLIPDVIQTLSIAIAMWAFLRALDDEEPHPRLWSIILAASMGMGLLLKSLIGVVFPVAVGLIYLFLTHQLFSARTWKRLHPFTGVLIAILIAAPWHILAAIRNPPYFVFTLHSGPGQYHGFLWFFFINEQLLRFLNMRYPRDYDTVPRLYFWLLHFAWLFPWSVYFPAVAKLSFKPVDRAGQTRLLALCWALFILIFFTFSTTQEYYSMPCYPALALLLGAAMAMGGAWVRRGTRVLAVIAGCAAVTIFAILFLVRHVPTPGDISSALVAHPNAYKLSLGHMEDLTLQSFAYLRLPLWIAGIAFLIGTLGSLRAVGLKSFVAATLMMVLFYHAARLAMVKFDPYLSSRPLAEVLMRSPEGTLITQGHFYPFSSVFFYTDRDGLLWRGRRINLEYGSYAPGAPNPFLDDQGLKDAWAKPDRCYLFAFDTALPDLNDLIGSDRLHLVDASGGKLLFTNNPLPPPSTP
jgi:4-amino-4-deoxy-L-arabinose transferase-like glycosyltransferase